MADSLFDNRYRYDYIYPRGRSGETLRAVDTAQNDRPVVIKRPAPNDAPPIRSGQEVSILNERKALTRLSGHSVLTELLGEGQFFVGGAPHQYIVMERADGMIVADEVLELARRGERLPQLEMLVILDSLLDLLQLAHSRDIVYNDVDAKHLFWDRDSYRLKLIDWGNAVFLEGDQVTPQGVSRQSDVIQVGELLYFILTGGGRLDTPRDADEDFRIEFGEDGERVSPHLQGLVSKAAHPNPRFRYKNVSDLKRDLAEYRDPFERERDAVVNRVAERLRRDLSKNDLRGLLNTLEPALASDPGFPPARKAHQEINDRLRDLDVSADLDAVRIYMEGGNWSRSAELLNELRDKAGPKTAGLVDLLLDTCLLLLDPEFEAASRDVPPAVLDSIILMFDGNFPLAATILLTQDTPDNMARKLQWLLAERISSKIPEVTLLRPNLYRLELALSNLEKEGINVSDARSLLRDIDTALDTLNGESTTHLAALRDAYREVVDQLTTLNKLLATTAIQYQLSNRKLPLNSLERSIDATMALADNMHVVGKQAAGSPRDAREALDNSRSINPTNPLWGVLTRLLDALYELLQSDQTYVPSADGSDLERWLAEARKDLQPFRERFFDEMLSGMVDGLTIAEQAWKNYMAAVVQGNRAGAVMELTQAVDAVGTISPTLAGWLNQLRAVVDGAHYVERHAVFGGLGRALADGWEAFDRGRLADSERLGQQALEIARDESGRFAATRLLKLTATARDWVERSGVSNARRTQSALGTIIDLFTDEERAANENFAKQMPSRETYLKAMNRGLVDIYARSSSAAVRLFYFNCILLGALEAHDANLDDARFWREAAVRTLGDHGPRHIATRTLEEFVELRRDINAAATLVNDINRTESLANLEFTRRQIEENPQARLMGGVIQSLREFEAALRDWSDGEFRSAGLKLENALKGAVEAEQSADIDLAPYRNWLGQLQAASAELHNLYRQMRQSVEHLPAEPQGVIFEAHQRAAETTSALLGESHAAQLQMWRDTYKAFLDVYTDMSVRRSVRLERFNELFRAMFIDRHPAYQLYRHWYDLTDASPEFPPPPTDDPTPRISDEAIVEETEYQGSRYVEEEPPLRPAVTSRRRGLPWRWIIPVTLVVVAGVAVGLALSGGNDDPLAGIDLIISETPDATEAAVALLTQATTQSDAVGIAVTTIGVGATQTSAAVSFITPTLITRTAVTPSTINVGSVTATTEPSATPVTPPDTPTPITPTNSPTPTVTDTPTMTYTPTLSPTPTLPPNGLQGWQDLVTLFPRIENLPWTVEEFAPATGNAGWRLGVGSHTPGDEIQVGLEPDTLDLYFGNDAPSRIRRTDATLSLTTFDPALLDSNDVYFGILLESVDDPTMVAGLYIQVVNFNAVNLWQIQGEERTFISQRSVNAVVARVRLERDPVSGDVLILFNDTQVGSAVPFIPPEAPVQPRLFVKDGGVIVGVTSWRINLS